MPIERVWRRSDVVDTAKSLFETARGFVVEGSGAELTGFVFTVDQKRGKPALGIVHPGLIGASSKDDFAAKLKMLSKGVGAEFTGIICEAWLYTSRGMDDVVPSAQEKKHRMSEFDRLMNEHKSVEHIPGSKEVLLMSVDGVGGFQVFLVGDIVRDANGKAINVTGPNLSFSGENGFTHEGRFVDMSGRSEDQ